MKVWGPVFRGHYVGAAIGHRLIRVQLAEGCGILTGSSGCVKVFVILFLVLCLGLLDWMCLGTKCPTLQHSVSPSEDPSAVKLDCWFRAQGLEFQGLVFDIDLWGIGFLGTKPFTEDVAAFASSCWSRCGKIRFEEVVPMHTVSSGFRV